MMSAEAPEEMNDGRGHRWAMRYLAPELLFLAPRGALGDIQTLRSLSYKLFEACKIRWGPERHQMLNPRIKRVSTARFHTFQSTTVTGVPKTL
jgi:hypothetical protein